MRKKFPQIVENGWLRDGGMATNTGAQCGVFVVKFAPNGCRQEASILRVIAGDGETYAKEGLPGPAWDHVSVSLADRCPTWAEMCFVKDLFFEDEECVVQFHPAKSQYVNDNPNVLHLWRICDGSFPMPPKECV